MVKVRATHGVLVFTLIGALACADDSESSPTDEEVADAVAAAMPAPAMPAPQPPAVDSVATGIDGVVADGSVVRVIGEGFDGTEGPLGMPDGTLLFTETNQSRVLQIDLDDVVSTFLEDTNGSNALGIDPEGRLVSVQTTPGQTQVGIIYPPGSEAVLSDAFEGQPYGRPNDLVVATTGDIYFTEPGPNVAAGMEPPPVVLPAAVYHLPPGGTARRIAEGIRRPNGIMLSPDEATLYVNDTQGTSLLAFDLQPDGSVEGPRPFATYDGVTTNADGTVASGADGLAIDAEGRLYAATTSGVQVFDTDGTRLGTIPVSRAPQNIAFAGPDKRTLFIVGRGAAYKLQMLTPGFAGRAK